MDYELPKLIQSDKVLKERENAEKKALFLTLANIFEADFSNNLVLDSLSLNSKYPEVTPIQWRKFLQYPVIKKYLDGFMEERIEKQALNQLSEVSAKDAVRVKESMDKNRQVEDNSRIVVMLLPQKDYTL